MKQIFRGKFLKKVKRRVPWIEHIINDEKTAGDLNIEADNVEAHAMEGSLCLICRGSKMLCGKTRCPALLKLYSFLKVKKIVDADRMAGSSPPGIFVGRMGYPHVYAGPLVPPVLGDTSLFDAPEQWVGRTVDEIVGFRTNLIRGKFRVNVKKPLENEQFLSKTLEIALAEEPVDTEVTFRNRPSGRFLFDEDIQPMGPSALLKKVEIGNAKLDSRIEKAYNDGDLKAAEALLDLYVDSVSVSKIQRAFSVGAFGLKKQRRIVPTRWSITAVDSTVSRRLIEDEVKGKQPINEYRVYEFNYLGNRFVILLTPSNWKYEWIEAWYPGTLWNPQSSNIAMGSDWEGYRGRTTYASLGGCYYAVRLAAAEFLAKERRQAGIIAMREIHPSFITPLGVWINRESVREAFRRGGKRFDTFKESLDYISSKFAIRLDEWIKTSTLLKDFLYQERITKYL
ncbi:MAG: Nre family DNA repair protein [Candidatus Bathyarchaeia archaeon]